MKIVMQCEIIYKHGMSSHRRKKERKNNYLSNSSIEHLRNLVRKEREPGDEQFH